VPLGDIGAVASVVGLAITVFIAFGVRKIKRSFLAKARLPELIRRLDKHASRLSSYLSDFPRFGDKARYELAQSQATLRSVERKLQGEQRRSCRTVRKMISKQRRRNVTSDDVARTYEEMTFLLQALKEYQQDLIWR